MGIMNGVIDGGSPLRLKADVLIRGSAITLAITTITLLDFLKIIIGGQFYSVFFCRKQEFGVCFILPLIGKNTRLGARQNEAHTHQLCVLRKVS